MTRPRLRVVQGGARKPGPIDAKRWITAVVSDRTLTVATRLVAAYIGSLHNTAKGYAYPSAKRIAQDTGFSLRTVWYAIDHLGKRHWLLINRGGGRGHANSYRINFETVQPDAPFDDEKGCKRRPERVQNDPDKQCNPVHPNKKDSNVEDSNIRRGTAGREAGPDRPAAPKRSARLRSRDGTSSEPRADGGLAWGSPPPAADGDQATAPESVLGPTLWRELHDWHSADHAATIIERGLKSRLGLVRYVKGAIRKAKAANEASNRAHAQEVADQQQGERAARERLEAVERPYREKIDAFRARADEVLGEGGRELVDEIVALCDSASSAASNLGIMRDEHRSRDDLIRTVTWLRRNKFELARERCERAQKRWQENATAKNERELRDAKREFELIRENFNADGTIQPSLR